MSAGRVLRFALVALAWRARDGVAQQVHHLPATPATVAWGYYSAAAPPVLRISSGDIVEVETLLTSTPDRLEAAGVAPGDVQQSLRDIVSQVTDHGPGGHILTGPIYVEGAQPGDALEVRILDARLALRYAYNGCRGFLPENCTDPQMGTDSNLTTATRIAVQEMIDFLAATRGLTKLEAYRLTSVAADVHVTELVDGAVGVHVTIPKALFQRAPGR